MAHKASCLICVAKLVEIWISYYAPGTTPPKMIKYLTVSMTTEK